MESLNPPVYLHYLDRELNYALRGSVDGQQAQMVTRRLILGTDSRLYCGLSAIYENDGLQQAQLRDLEDLLASGELDAVSHQDSRDEFLEQRQILYRHDAVRYPRYFTDEAERLLNIRPTLPKSGGTTRNLVRSMRDWVEDVGIDSLGDYARGPLVVAPRVSDALRHREDEAITYAYFRRYMEGIKNPASAERVVRRQISEAFTADYLRMMIGADIATGVRGLEAFDAKLARHFPRFDDRLMSVLFYYCGLGDVLDPSFNYSRWQAHVAARPSVSHGLMVGYIATLIRSLDETDREGSPAAGFDPDDWFVQHEVRRRLADRLKTAARDIGAPNTLRLDSPPEDIFEQVTLYIVGLAAKLEKRLPPFAAHFEKNRRLIVPEYADVVLLVSTPLEQEVLESEFSAAGYGTGRLAHGEVNSYRIFGPIGGSTVALVRSSVGSGGSAGSTATVQDTIHDLRPRAVIAVGIAFGISADKTPLGTVLVATQVLDYETQKRQRSEAGAEVKVIPRGDKIPSSAMLLSRLRATHMAGILQSLGTSVEEGLLLSGAKLIDDIQFRDQLVLDLAPEAIGGEMEATGLAAASYRRNTHWLVIKAVCDFADGRKGTEKLERQRSAARNASRVVIAMLEAGGVAGVSSR